MLRSPIRRALLLSALAAPLLAWGVRAASVSWTEYLAARAAFKAEVEGYWTSIADKRRGRNAKRREHQQITLDDYVLTQPPVYHGPPRPPGPSPEPVPDVKPRVAKPIPVVSDLLAADPRLTKHMDRKAIDKLLDPTAYTGLCADMAREGAARAKQATRALLMTK